MQLLEAAGLAVLSDGQRPADEDNPRGYYELAAVKRMPQDMRFLASAVGRAIKVVAPLVPLLPDDYDYRLLIVDRDIEEVLASQRRMLLRAGRSAEAEVSDERLSAALKRARRDVDRWVDSRRNVEAISLSHRRLLEAPHEACRELARFLARTHAVEQDVRDACAARMSAVVDPALHRNRPARAQGRGRLERAARPLDGPKRPCEDPR